MEAANPMASDGQDVDKSGLFDAEQFLSNFSNLRDECERLKSENQQLQLRVQQMSQELNQSRLEKDNLEKHVQNEAVQHKETVWNLKLEAQRSQEERLAWKEKFLDLCIKTSAIEAAKDPSQPKVLKLDIEEKKVSKRPRRKVTRKNKQDANVAEPEADLQVEALTNDDVKMFKAVNKQCDVTDSSASQADPQSEALQSSCADETINAVEMVSTLSSNLNPDQNPNVSSETGYYSLPPGTFDCQPVAGNATTFILQTSDATYCATAVLDDSQRPAGFPNTSVPFTLKPENNTFTNTQPFPGGNETEDSDSDESTQFNFRCGLCNFTYSDQTGLDKHMKAKHSAKTVVCKECGKAYSSKSSLAQHVHHYHRYPMAHICNICEKKFNRKDFLVKHLKTHTDERDLKCTHCEKRFKTRSAISAHMNGSHNEKRRFVCDFCGMRTSWRLSYLEHMKLHTGEPRRASLRKKAQQQQQEVDHQVLEQLVSEPSVQFITTVDS